MTGWRIGYAAGPADIIDRMVKCQENFNACANAPGQYAAAIALEHPELSEQLCTVFAGRRKLLLAGLAGIDGSCSSARRSSAFRAAHSARAARDIFVLLIPVKRVCCKQPWSGCISSAGR